MVNSRVARGDRFGRWTILDAPTRERGRSFVTARCSCGTTRRVEMFSLLRGGTKSCGCFRREWSAQKSYKHGRHSSPLYATWYGMVRRCHNVKDTKYPDYGGRGVEVCPEWRNDVNAFCEYIETALGEKPSASHSLDRIDNDRGYEPGNLRWATPRQQTANRRTPARLVRIAELEARVAELQEKLSLVGA